MAVYKRTYRGYSGGLTTPWSRFLVIFRYSRRNLFRSKFLTGFFLSVSFFRFLCLLGIYANDHVSAFFLGQRRMGRYSRSMADSFLSFSASVFSAPSF